MNKRTLQNVAVTTAIIFAVAWVTHSMFPDSLASNILKGEN